MGLLELFVSITSSIIQFIIFTFQSILSVIFGPPVV